MKKCKKCGAVLPNVANRCPECGGISVSVWDKTIGIEKKHHVFSNVLTIALAVAFILLSLLCPVKLIALNVSEMSGITAYDSASAPSVPQTLWQTLGALGYANLDAEDEADMAKIQDIVLKYNEAREAVSAELEAWTEANFAVDKSAVGAAADELIKAVEESELGEEFGNKLNEFKEWSNGLETDDKKALDEKLDELMTDLNLEYNVYKIMAPGYVEELVKWIEKNPDASSAAYVNSMSVISQSLASATQAYVESKKDNIDAFDKWVSGKGNTLGEEDKAKAKEFSAWLNENADLYETITGKSAELCAYFDGIAVPFKAARVKKTGELNARHYKKVNMLGYTLAVTTDGAMKTESNNNGVAGIEELIMVERNEAMLALIMELFVVFVHFGVALVSLVYLVLAAVALCRKKVGKPFVLMSVVLLLSGIGFLLQSVTPMFDPTSAMFIVAAIAACVYLASGAVKALADGKDKLCVIKRGVVAACTVLAFLMLGSTLLSVTMEYSGDIPSVTMKTPLGSAFSIMVLCSGLRTVTVSALTMTFKFSEASTAGALLMLLFGAAAILCLLASARRSLGLLANNAECKAKIDVWALAGIVMLLLFAVVPAVTGAVGKPPLGAGLAGDADGALQTITFGLLYKYAARWGAYVSMGFAVAGFVTELAWRVKPPQIVGSLPKYSYSAM